MSRDVITLSRDVITLSRDVITLSRDVITLSRDDIPLSRDAIPLSREGVKSGGAISRASLGLLAARGRDLDLIVEFSSFKAADSVLRV